MSQFCMMTTTPTQSQTKNGVDKLEAFSTFSTMVALFPKGIGFICK